MKENTYKFLKFLNRNKYIVAIVFLISFFALTKNIYAATDCGFLDVGCYLDRGIGTIFIGIALFFISFSAWVFGLLFPIFLNITGWLLNSGPINTAWILIRDFVNMFFIFFLLFTSLAKLVGKEKMLKQGSATKQVIYILLAAFLINFSKVICGVVVDITQIITLQFTNAFVDGLGNLGSIFSANPDGTAPTPSILVGILFIIFALAFLATAMTALLYILIRAVSLGIYAAFSPLWFLWLSFPTKSKQVEQIKTETMDKFFQAAMGGPILAFYLWISLMLINPGSGSLMDSVNQAGSGNSTKTLDSTPVSSDGTTAPDINGALIMRMVVASAVMLFAQQQAMKMAKQAGTVMGKGLMDGVVNKVSAVGMKPLDGLKNAAQSTAKNLGNSISNTAGKIGDTAMGGIKNGIGMARGGNNIASKMLDKGLKMKENMSANAIKNSEAVSQRKSQNDALQKALKSGDPAAIAKAREAVNKRQIEQGKKVSADIRNAGGLPNYLKVGKVASSVGDFVGDVKKQGIIKATGGAVVSGVKNVFSDDTTKAQKEKARLEKLREKMAANPQKYTKDDISRVTTQIGEQEAIVKKEKERQRLSDFNSTRNSAGIGMLKKERDSLDVSKLSKSALTNSEVIKALKDKQRSNGLTIEESDELDKLEQKQRRYGKMIDYAKSDKGISRKKDIDSLFDKDGNIIAKTKDDIKKQEAAYLKADGNIAKASDANEKARVKAAGISEPEKENEKQKSFNSSKDKIKEANGGWELDGDKDRASKINALAERNDEGKIAAMMLKLENGGNLKNDELKWLEKHQKEFASVVEQLDKDTIDKINNSISSASSGKIAAVAPKSKDYIENTHKAVNSLIDSYTENYINSLSEQFKGGVAIDEDGKSKNIDHPFIKLLKEKRDAIAKQLDLAKSNGDGFASVEDEIRKLEKLTSLSKGNKDLDITALKKMGISLGDVQEIRNARGQEFMPSQKESGRVESLNDISNQISNGRQINIHPDSFNSLKKTIKGSLRDLDSSVSSKLEKLVESIGSISESDMSGKPGRVSMDESSITQLASVLGESMNPGQFNSLVDSIHGLAKSDEKSADAMIDFIKALQKAMSKDDSKGIS